MGMATILVIDAEQFEQIDSIPSTEGPKSNLVKIGQVVSEKKTLKDFIHLYSTGARADNLRGQKLILTKRVCYFDHTLLFFS